MDRNAIKAAASMTTALILQIPTGATSYNGVHKPSGYQDSPNKIFANFKTFGGTETQVNGVLEIIDTAEVTTWFRPDIKSNCRIKRVEDGAIYEILGEPEDIEQRHQLMKFKIRRVKGGA